MEQYNNSHIFNTYLQPDEYIAWRGQPGKGFVFSAQDFIMIPFSIFWLGFALFWEWGAIQSGIPFMMIWGLPFIAIGLYMLFGRYIYGAYLRGKTHYAVTNRRLIIIKGSRVMIYDAKDLPPMTLQMHKNGNGTISFSETSYYRRGRHYTNYFALENIKDPVRAQNAISAMER